jgi:hypothetical protein
MNQAPRNALSPTADESATANRLQVSLIVIAIVVGTIGKLWHLVWHAPYGKDEVVPYKTFLGIRDGWYLSHYFGGTLMGLGFIGLALAACVLVRRVGSTLTTVGAGLTALGGLFVAPGLAAEGASYSYASDTNALPQKQGTVMLRFMFDHQDRAVVLLLVGLGLITIGCILLGVGLLRARVVPVWVPVALIVGTLLFATTPLSVTWWASLPATVASLAIGWYAWQGANPRDLATQQS